MTALVKILPKGQITIPQNVREKFHILPQTYLELEVLADGFVLKPFQKKESSLQKPVFQKSDFAGRDMAFSPQQERIDDDMEMLKLSQNSFLQH